MEKFNFEKYPRELAESIYNATKDMDYMDYEDEKELVLSDLENALYYLKTICENEHNENYFRTFYRILERL